MLKESTLKFLKNLKKHNTKTWFDENRSGYLDAKTDFENLTIQLISHTSAYDHSLKTLQAKDCTFRIHRDVRFSKDKIPYKSNMGAYLSRGGKKSIFGGYYFHLDAEGECFAGGGMWMPAAPELKKVRQEIDYCFAEFSKILKNPAFKKTYGELQMEKNQMLARVPKGYDIDNPAAEYLKLKSFVATARIPEKELFKPGLEKNIAAKFQTLMPLIHFMNRALE